MSIESISSHSSDTRGTFCSSDDDGTYNFEVGKQPHDVSHVGEDEQAGDSREQGAGGPHHRAAFHRGTRVIGKLWRGNTHRLSCKRGGINQYKRGIWSYSILDYYLYVWICVCVWGYCTHPFLTPLEELMLWYKYIEMNDVHWICTCTVYTKVHNWLPSFRSELIKLCWLLGNRWFRIWH